MICPFCGKLGHDTHSFCLYCGASFPSPELLFPALGEKDSVDLDEPEEKVYDVHDVTEFEWGCFMNTPSEKETRNTPRLLERNVYLIDHVAGHEWHSQAGVKSLDENRGKPEEKQLFPGSPKNYPEGFPKNGHSSEKIHENGRKSRSLSEEELLREALSGSYEIVRKLGIGGMASVYLAREPALAREVAIKLLPRAYLSDQQFIARFKREAQLSAMLEHPNIVRIYRISEEKDLCYFVMNYISGGTLTERMKKQGSLTLQEVVQWGMDICSALSYAHEHGVIHRDMKPDNIMLDGDDRAVVMDFGIAYAIRGTSLTQSGAVIGTPQYMSPDQACGKELDARSDIYSLGMVLYQMAAGSLPFLAADAVSLMYMHVHNTPESPDTRNPHVPRWLRDIILTCLAKKPENRFSSARELRQALSERRSPIRYPQNRKVRKRVEKKKGIQVLFHAAADILSGAVPGFLGIKAEMKKKNSSRIKQESAETRLPPKLPRNLSHPSHL
jgi:serine/threonine protein kinase